MITINDLMVIINLETMDGNLELETKIDGQMEDSVLKTDIIIKNREKETVEKTADDVKATHNYIVPRPYESNSKKLSTSGINRKVTLSTTKNKSPAIEECTDIKARPSVKPTNGQPSIKHQALLMLTRQCL